MLESVPGPHHISLTSDKLLAADEVIVIVDDDAAIREPLRVFLETQKLTVVEAENAEQLRKLFGSVNIALVLLDIGLPDTDGLTLLPEIVNDHP